MASYVPAAVHAQSAANVNAKAVTSVHVPRVDRDVHVPAAEHAVRTANAAKRALARSVRTAINAVYVRHVGVIHVRIQNPADVPESYAQNAMSVQYAATAAAATDPDRVAPELAQE